MEKTDYLQQIEKQSSERRLVTIDYSEVLGSASLSSVAVTGYNIATASTDNTVISSTTGTIIADTATIYVRSGSSGQRYRITFTATLDDSQVFKDDILMTVKDI